MRHRTVRPYAVVAIMLGLVACSSKAAKTTGNPSSTGTSAATATSTAAASASGSSIGGTTHAGVGLNPCGFAKPSDIAANFGGTVAEGLVKDEPFGQTCHYAVTKPDVGPDGEVVIFLSPEQTPATFATAKQLVPNVVDAPGIGKDAFYNSAVTSVEFITEAGSVGTVQAIFLGISGPKPDPAKLQTATVGLAKTVAAAVGHGVD